MKKQRPHPLDELAHDLNGMRLLLDIWHDKIPSPVFRGLSRRIASMEDAIRLMRRSVGEEHR